MALKIFTICFSEASKSFHDDLVEKFCLNKRVHDIDTNFFVHGGVPYWTIAIQYETVLVEDKGPNTQRIKKENHPFDEVQKLIFDQLRVWRKRAAEESGIPAYMICTNSQLVQMIFEKCNTLESLKLVKGFGKSRIEKHGKAIIEIIRSFNPHKE